MSILKVEVGTGLNIRASSRKNILEPDTFYYFFSINILFPATFNRSGTFLLSSERTSERIFNLKSNGSVKETNLKE